MAAATGLAIACLALFVPFGLAAWPVQGEATPTADAIIARLVKADAVRRQSFRGYTAQRTYEVVNGARKAQMLVRVRCADTGDKAFDVLSESGPRVIRSLVLRKMLDAESEGSRASNRSEAEITPRNYEFVYVGTVMAEGRPAYVLDAIPRAAKKFLIRGRIWIDAADYAIARIEGTPAKPPSFWLRETRITYVYARHGDLWLPSLTRSTSKVRLFGTAAATITTGEYVIADSPAEE